MALAGSGIWFAAKELSGPMLGSFRTSSATCNNSSVGPMTDRRFIRIHNKLIHLDSIAYVDFLDSGRAMIFMRGLTQENRTFRSIPTRPFASAPLSRRTRTRIVGRAERA